MKILLLCFAQKEEDFIRDGVSEYEARIKKYFPFETKILKPVGKEMKEQQAAEEKMLDSYFTNDSLVVLLDEKGKQFSSTSFAKYFQSKLNSGKKKMVFVIGGAYGFSEAVKTKAHDVISLSELTFPHQLAKLIFCEQLYRTCTILKGEKYHHQ